MYNGKTAVHNLKSYGREYLDLNIVQKDGPKQRLDLNKITLLDIISIVFILLLSVGIILKTKLGPNCGQSD